MSVTETHITQVKINEYKIEYAHGKPLSEFNIHNCPNSIFDFESTYFKSLMSMYQLYSQNLEKVTEQLKAFNTEAMNEYIKSNFDELKSKYVSLIQSEIDELKNTSADDLVAYAFNSETLSNELVSKNTINSLSNDMLSEISEKQSILDNIDEIVTNELISNWFIKFDTNAESEDILKEHKSNWSISISNLLENIEEWKQRMLEIAIDNERIVIEEFLSIPYDQTIFDKQLIEHINTELTKHTTDIKESILDDVKCKFNTNTLRKFHTCIDSEIMCKPSNKCYKYIDSFMEVINYKILDFINRLYTSRFDTTLVDWYELKKTLFTTINELFDNVSRILYKNIHDKINLIKPFDDTITTKTGLTKAGSSLVNSINNSLISIPILINDYKQMTGNGDIFNEINSLIKDINDAYIHD